MARKRGTRRPLWLVIEWPPGEDKPTEEFTLTSLPRRMSKKPDRAPLQEALARTERAYEDLKGELGLSITSRSRSFPGWHHHVSVVLCCYAFIVAERVRHFPPRSRNAPIKPRRTASRPELHFVDSFITIRLAIAAYLARWLPRCPTCRRPR